MVECLIFLFCLERLRCKMIGNTQPLDGAGHKPSEKVYIQSMSMMAVGQRTHV